MGGSTSRNQVHQGIAVVDALVGERNAKGPSESSAQSAASTPQRRVPGPHPNQARASATQPA